MAMKFLLITAMAALLFSCTKDSDGTLNASANGSGKGGSLARFTIVDNNLYLVDDASLKIFNITDPANAVIRNTIYLRFGVETIFPYKDKLFIGSRDGMYIYSIANPDVPVLLGEARHGRSCDPVVANDSTAFVTLRGGQPCGPVEDGLYIYTITNILTPTLINKQLIPTPNGLGLQDSILYVCQKNNGMSIYNVTNPSSPVLRKKMINKVFEDVICYGDILICYVSTGLALYDIREAANPVLISEVNN
jgi:hypothetical protein